MTLVIRIRSLDLKLVLFAFLAKIRTKNMWNHQKICLGAANPFLHHMQVLNKDGMKTSCCISMYQLGNTDPHEGAESHDKSVKYQKSISYRVAEMERADSWYPVLIYFSYLDFFGAVEEKKKREKYIFIKNMVLIPVHPGCANIVCFINCNYCMYSSILFPMCPLAKLAHVYEFHLTLILWQLQNYDGNKYISYEK